MPPIARLLALIPVVLLCAAASGCARQNTRDTEEEIAVPVIAEPVLLGNIRGVVSATGQVTTLAGAELSIFAPQVARIAEVTKNVGDPVKSGELLVRFEFPSLRAESVAGAAAVRAAELRAKNAKTMQDRLHALLERGAASRMEVDAADRDASEADAELAQARAGQSATEAQGRNTTLLAPLNGVVSGRLHNPGDTVGVRDNDPILRILDPKQVQVTATVAIADAKRFALGAQARVVAEGRATTELLRVATRPDAEPGATTIPVVLEFASPTDLAPGIQVGVEIDAEQRLNVPVVPPIAVVRNEKNGAAVFIASGNVARRRPVVTGLVDTEHVEIISGLKPGELIVTQGISNLRDGTAITVTP
jgi:RND family efflux transporter MFP subunit